MDRQRGRQIEGQTPTPPRSVGLLATSLSGHGHPSAQCTFLLCRMAGDVTEHVAGDLMSVFASTRAAEPNLGLLSLGKGSTPAYNTTGPLAELDPLPRTGPAQFPAKEQPMRCGTSFWTPVTP